MSEHTNEDDGELGDFEGFASDDEEDEEQVERKAQRAITVPDLDDEEDVEEFASEVAEASADENVRKTVLRAVNRPEENPLDLDPRVGLRDVCYDRAKPGAKVYVVDVLGETVADYYERFPDAPALDEYAGNVVSGFSEDMAVFAVVYLKDSLTKADTGITAYPMPEGRLTRYPAEQAAMVGSSSVEFERSRLPEEVVEEQPADEEGEE